MIDAVLIVLPVDDFVPQALFRASVKGDPALADPCTARSRRSAPAACLGGSLPWPAQTFYERVKTAYAVVATSEPRLYANFIVRKGVIYPQEPDKP